jgi:glucosamine kinase
MSYFLAIDAGGTKTDYVLADETQELARVRSGTIKRMRTDEDSAARNLHQALAELTTVSGIPMSAIGRTCIGTAGETVRLVTDWLRAAFGARVAGELILLGDVEIALDAAFFGQPGVLVLAGTGSNVAGRDVNGAVSRAGGWGPALADQGSGNRIGQNALRAMFLGLDEGRPTSLLAAVKDFWKLHSIDEIIGCANQIPSPDFSQLTHLVLRCAEDGDEISQIVLQKEGEDLGYLVRLVMRRLCAASPDREWIPQLAFTGSIMEKIDRLRGSLIASVQSEFPTLQVVDGVVDPIAGALWRARAGG